MMNILAANNSSWIMLVVLGVLMVGMMVLSIVPQKKRQKKAQEMMESIRVGTKVKTIGGFIGTIKAIDNNAGTFTLDMSAAEDDSIMVILDKSAVYTTLTPNVEGVLEETQAPKEEVAEDEVEAENKLAEKKAEKAEKKAAKKEAEVVAEEVVEEAPVVDAEIIPEAEVKEEK